MIKKRINEEEIIKAINTFFVKSDYYCYGRSSLGLKHDIERYLNGYVNIDTFQACMSSSGFVGKYKKDGFKIYKITKGSILKLIDRNDKNRNNNRCTR